MDRIKLEYITKNMPVKAAKELYARIDVSGFGDFSMMYSRFLENPKTTDPLILSIVPGYDKKENIDAFMSRYSEKFELMNKLCIENEVYPIFPNPSNIQESVEVRRDLIKPVPEEELNKFFRTSSFAAYKPPLYKAPKQPGN